MAESRRDQEEIRGSEPSVVVHTSNSSAREVETKQFGSSLTTYSVGVNLDYM